MNEWRKGKDRNHTTRPLNLLMLHQLRYMVTSNRSRLFSKIPFTAFILWWHQHNICTVTAEQIFSTINSRPENTCRRILDYVGKESGVHNTTHYCLCTLSFTFSCEKKYLISLIEKNVNKDQVLFSISWNQSYLSNAYQDFKRPICHCSRKIEHAVHLKAFSKQNSDWNMLSPLSQIQFILNLSQKMA